ncbi:MAG: hypothetical protein K2W92_05690 [Alphaproteobacteria bacterium]|nr:hypothetical protein [Alphaproteobacteria bacterium]
MKIKIIPTLKESFKEVLDHKIKWGRVAFSPLFLWLLGLAFMVSMHLLTGHPILPDYALINPTSSIEHITEVPFLVSMANVIYYIIYIIAIFNLYINGFRYAVLHEAGDRWINLHFNRRFFKMILYSILIGLMAGLYALVVVGITVGIHYSFESIILNIALGTFFAIFGFYLIFRIGLTFLFIAIDQENPIKTSWKLLQGNVLRLLGLIFLIWLSIFLISVIGIVILGVFGWVLYLISPILAGIALILIILFALSMWLLNWAVFSKSLALIYKDLTTL